MAVNYLETFQSRKFVLILIPLGLSSFTHLWNPVGFPDIFYDEGVYLRRAMHVLEGLGPQESDNYYDHPFFGQIFLASIFKLINFPNFIDYKSANIQSIDSLYSVPRIIVGVLAVLDTYLIYKIAESKYGTKAAIIASILFAVMPMSWITRRIVLDSILLPFLLMSILFALYSAKSSKKSIWIALSGICLGLAIFTKIPMFTMIPLISYLILGQNNKVMKQNSYKILALWFIPVILIPSLWPLESILSGNFDAWLRTVSWQTLRGDRTLGLSWITDTFIGFDPILFVLSVAGGIYAGMRKNWFVMFWTVPYLVFLALIGQTNYFHWTALLPVFCISSSLVLLEGIPRLISSARMTQVLTSSIFVSISVLGLVFTTMLIATDVSLSQRQTAAYVMSYLDKHDEPKQITVISSPTYSWVFKYVYRVNNTLDDYRDIIFFPIKTPDWILVADYHFKAEMRSETKLHEFYKESKQIATFSSYPLKDELTMYPYTSLLMTKEGTDVELRIPLLSKIRH